MSQNKKPSNQSFPLDIPIISGSAVNLTKFDFSFKKISILDIQSKKFEKYIRKLQAEPEGREISFLKALCRDIHKDTGKKYAIVFNNPIDDYDEMSLYNVWRILLIIYPSDLQIQHTIHYFIKDGIFGHPSYSTYPKTITGDYPGNLLYAGKEEIVEVNEFTKAYFDRVNIDNFVGFSIQNYITSFTSSHYHYQYLSLCIALESLIAGNTELTYRLSRTVAVLCGKDSVGSSNLFDALKKIYALRSDIVHGKKYKLKTLLTYLKLLQAIVSRAIIELLIHNISNIDELGDIITKLGFGQREQISLTWKLYKLNYETLRESNRTRLMK